LEEWILEAAARARITARHNPIHSPKMIEPFCFLDIVFSFDITIYIEALSTKKDLQRRTNKIGDLILS
jgi:hypothetical protein